MNGAEWRLTTYRSDQQPSTFYEKVKSLLACTGSTTSSIRSAADFMPTQWGSKLLTSEDLSRFFIDPGRDKAKHTALLPARWLFLFLEFTGCVGYLGPG